VWYLGSANTKFNDRVSKLFSDKFCHIGKLKVRVIDRNQFIGTSNTRQKRACAQVTPSTDPDSGEPAQGSEYCGVGWSNRATRPCDESI
jgi:hypothetical protein